MSALSLLLSVAIGYLIIHLARPADGLRPRWAAVAFEVSLGVAAGVAIGGAQFFVLRILGLASPAALFALDVLLVAALAALVWRRRGPSGEPAVAASEEHPKWRWTWLLAVCLGIAMLLTLAVQTGTVQASPYGEWDAFSIWNLRAKFLAGPGDAWQFAVSPLLEETHPEYPPVLSAFIAKLWVCGDENGTPFAPIAAGLLLSWVAFALLASAIALLRGPAQGLLACTVLFATSSFLRQSTAQYADIPVAVFFMVTLALLAFTAAPQRHGSQTANAHPSPTTLLFLAGAFASASALLKDEGLPFLLLVAICYTAFTFRSSGKSAALFRLRWLAAGAAPGVLLLAFFKLFLAPGMGGVLRGQTASQVLDKLIDPERYAMILFGSLDRFLALGDGLTHPVILLVILAAVLRFNPTPRFRSATVPAALVLALIMVTYWGVYLVTPDDLEWRINTSLDRLYIQLWPSLLFVIFLLLNTPSDPERPVEAPETKSEKKRKKRKRVRTA